MINYVLKMYPVLIGRTLALTVDKNACKRERN